MQFTPLEDFHDPDLRSDYCAGLTYTVRPGNTALAAKVEKWLTEGRVQVVGGEQKADAVAGDSAVHGIGTIGLPRTK